VVKWNDLQRSLDISSFNYVQVSILLTSQLGLPSYCLAFLVLATAYLFS
jgi:hypothetical protein